MSRNQPLSKEAEAILCELLVLKCRRGDAAAWRDLVRLFELRLLYYLRRLLHDPRDAWDVLQQTWLEVFRNLRTLRDPRALRPWLYRIAHHRAISHWRASGGDAAIELHEDADQGGLNELPAPAAAAAEEDWTAEQVERLHQSLGQLAPPQREVITLFFLEEMPIDEIAQVLGVPAGTVKSRLHYGKSALRQILTQEEAR